MPRWEHGSEDRLKQAALELFDEQGFEDTSTIEIAARAGVTNRTFFRYFADKREVLSADADDLRTILVEKLRQAPDFTEPLRAVIGVLAEFDWEMLGPRDMQRRRHAVIAANPELLERDLVKHQTIAVEFTAVLRQRGVGADVARLAARVGVQLFLTAYEDWLQAGDGADLSKISESLMSLLAAIVPASARTM
jgi:AcrR family transcriptional regulator